MTGKLNLSIDEMVKERIKEYALIRNISLSNMVETYFRNLLYSSEAENLRTPLTDSLAGVLKGISHEEAALARLEHLEEKYLNG